MRAPLFYRIREFFARMGARGAAVGRGLTYPFERLLHWLGHRLVHGSESVSRAEGGLVTLGRAVTWPVRFTWRLLAGVGGLLAPEWLRRAWGRAWHGIVHAAGRAIDVLNLDGLVRRTVWISQPLWRPVAAVLGFLYAWFSTRAYKQMLWGLPALVLLLPVVAAIGWRLFGGRESVARTYQAAVEEALEEEDYEAMRRWEQKLGQLEVTTERKEYFAALKLTNDDEDSKRQAGLERMEQLAPRDAPGYPTAHFWLANWYLSGDRDLDAAARLAIVQQHLEQLDASGVKWPELTMVRATWLIQSDRLPEAAALLEPLAGDDPAAASQLLLLDLTLGRRDAARRDATRVRDFIADARRRGAVLAPRDLRTLATAHQVLGDLAGFEAALEQWLALEPDRQEARAAMGSLAAAQLQMAVAQRKLDVARIAQLLNAAARYGSPPQAIHRALAKLSSRNDKDRVRAQLVQAVLAQQDAPASLLASIGTTAAAAGDFESAERLLRLATTAAPDDARTWNNLAWVLSNLDEPANLEDAHQAANRAVELSPDTASFRETRGQVLVKLRRWDAAISDLEYALNGLPNSKPTHAALAKAYAELGQDDLAAAHSALAD